MLWNIPTILGPQELLDKALRKASKISVSAASNKKIDVERAKTVAKIHSVRDTLCATLDRYVRAFPSMDNIHPFYRSLIDVLIGVDSLRISLASVSGCSKNIRKVAREIVGSVRRARSVEYINKKRKEFYGRISSMIYGIGDNIAFLQSARETIKSFPEVSPNLPTVVIAGAPNVGKSMIVACLSSAKPKIASYPFTTKKLSVGHFVHEHMKYQVIDTPGLLDRPLEQRNKIERQAILALRYLAHLIVFVFDLSESCGYGVGEQKKILQSIKKDFRTIPMIIVENKSDICDKTLGFVRISALTGKGIEELLSLIAETMKHRKRGGNIEKERIGTVA
ncbi:MAG: GTPase [Thermoplasmata archaeon]|nr:MAG: GTPase [Thermoplasmata archaeon]